MQSEEGDGNKSDRSSLSPWDPASDCESSEAAAAAASVALQQLSQDTGHGFQCSYTISTGSCGASSRMSGESTSTSTSASVASSSAVAPDGLAHPRASAVQQLRLRSDEVVATFHSQSEASRITGIPRKHISNCCLGRRETAGTFRWRTFIDVVTPSDTEAAIDTRPRFKQHVPVAAAAEAAAAAAAAAAAYDGGSEGGAFGGMAATRSLRAPMKKRSAGVNSGGGEDGGFRGKRAALDGTSLAAGAGVEPTTRLPYDLLCLAALGRASPDRPLLPPAAVAASLLRLMPSLCDGVADARRAADRYEQVVRATVAAAVARRSPDVVCLAVDTEGKDDVIGLTHAGAAKYAALQQLFAAGPLAPLL